MQKDNTTSKQIIDLFDNAKRDMLIIIKAVSNGKFETSIGFAIGTELYNITSLSKEGEISDDVWGIVSNEVKLTKCTANENITIPYENREQLKCFHDVYSNDGYKQDEGGISNFMHEITMMDSIKHHANFEGLLMALEYIVNNINIDIVKYTKIGEMRKLISKLS